MKYWTLVTGFLTSCFFGVGVEAQPDTVDPCRVEQAPVAPADVTSNDLFGASLDYSSGTLFVGLRGADRGAVTGAGAVYLFGFEGGQWMLSHELSAPSPAANDQFGFSLSYHGGRVVVGAPNSDLNGPNCGVVFVYEPLEGQGWQLEAVLTATTAADGAAFGWSVRCEGERIAVGAPQHTGGGRVHLFERDSVAGWQEVAVNTQAGGGSRGSSVELDGNRLVVGDPALGRAEVYVLEEGAWNLSQTLQPSDLNGVSATFGAAVAIQGSQLFVGAPHRDGGPGATDDRGGIYRFFWDGSEWAESQLLLSANPRVRRLGESLAMTSQLLVAGAPGTYDETGSAFEGGAVLFRPACHDGCWEEAELLQSSSGRYLDESGRAVAVGETMIALGAPFRDAAGQVSTGEVQVFARTDVDCDGNTVPDFCDMAFDPGADTNQDGLLDACQAFRRGDLNASGTVSFPDVVELLLHLFVATDSLVPCEDAADGNDDGKLNLSDVVVILNYLFLPDAPPLPLPGATNCDLDPTTDALHCTGSPSC